MIYFRNDVPGAGIASAQFKRVATKVLKAAKAGDASLSISLVDDRTIRKLNRKHRGKDKATDVLSFPLSENPERLLGDVVISIDTARRQAAEYDAPLQNELHRLLIHGILHVLGHDHEEAEERRIMEAEERRLAEAIGMRWPYD